VQRRSCKLLHPLWGRRYIKCAPLGAGLFYCDIHAFSSPPVVLCGRGDAGGGTSSSPPICDTQTVERAARGARAPWSGGKLGNATPSDWGRLASCGWPRRMQGQCAVACAVPGHGGSFAKCSLLCGGGAGSQLRQGAGSFSVTHGASASSSRADLGR